MNDIEDIHIHQFTDKDVVRHKLVQKIILAYDKFEKKAQENAEKRKNEQKTFKRR